MRKLIFLDDERNPSDVFWLEYPEYAEIFIVRNYFDFSNLIASIEDFENFDISFDHDIQDFPYDDEKEYTGYDCMKWLCNYIIECEIEFEPDVMRIYVHSQNPIGRENILNYWRGFCEYYLEVLNDF